jgi:hypothetical protein
MLKGLTAGTAPEHPVLQVNISTWRHPVVGVRYEARFMTDLQKDRDARWTVKWSKAKPADDGSGSGPTLLETRLEARKSRLCPRADLRVEQTA